MAFQVFLDLVAIREWAGGTFKVQDIPELEGRVGDGQLKLFLIGELHCPVEGLVVVWVFDIKDTPNGFKLRKSGAPIPDILLSFLNLGLGFIHHADRGAGSVFDLDADGGSLR